jgi:hypothetical protein
LSIRKWLDKNSPLQRSSHFFEKDLPFDPPALIMNVLKEDSVLKIFEMWSNGKLWAELNPKSEDSNDEKEDQMMAVPNWFEHFKVLLVELVHRAIGDR